MAKAADEILCEALQAADSRVVTKRLSKLPTDQTASLLPSVMPDPLD